MPTTPSKRSAATPPSGSRPYKRQATSSPEEGELDSEGSPSPPVRPATPPRTQIPANSTANAKSKVPFPFKRKSAPPLRDERPEPTYSETQAGHSRAPPLVYERPEPDTMRYREDDWHVRGMSRPVDHWQPSMGRYDGNPRPRWGGHDTYGPSSYHPHGSISPRRDRERERDWDWDRARDSRDMEREGRARSRSTSSPRSLSPLSPEVGKEKHRLPPPRKISVSPHDGSLCSPRGRSYGRRTPSRERRRSPALRTRDMARQPAYEGDSYVPDNDDRLYRRLDNSWDRERRWDRPRYDDYDSSEQGYRRGLNSYRPISPAPLSPRSPARRRISRSRTPPPPRSPLPPLPANRADDQVLPTQHTTIKIPLPSKKPSTPVNIHSPTPLPLPAQRMDMASDGKRDHKRAESDARVAVQRSKRKPVIRTREEEHREYGRVFEGCGKQEDYNVLTKLGEGTFGEVHKAIHREKHNAVALKRILMHNEKEGMPVTALREIKILKALRHPCIVDILDMFVVRSQGKDSPLSVYMVFPYMDHDLAGLLENERVKLSPSQIKLYMKQLLEGTEYMHRNHILHRDMKAANLLISNDGSLKIADFGLARAFDPTIVDVKEDAKGKERKYTNCVVTRWYRPPELLLGARQYGGEVDMWGVGCVLGEMFWRRPILPGSSDLDQLDKIWQLCGTPTQFTWPNYDNLPGCEGIKRFNSYPRRLKTVYEMLGPETLDLLDKLLTCNPKERITAEKALDHEYFWTDPLPADPKTLPRYEASHEFDKRGRRNQAPVGPSMPLQIDPSQRSLPMPPAPPPNRRPPPPREAFRNGPLPPHFVGPPGMMQGPPVPPYPPFPPLGNVRYPPNFGHGPGAMPMPPASLAPISLRPGQPPPQIGPWQQHYSRPPPNLPPRPPAPLGRGGGYHQSQGYSGGPLNYG